MKIAMIGDIHANLPALQAVLDDIQRRGADMIINAGDSVGYGAFPEETVALIRERKIPSVLGNYDARVLEIKNLPSRRKPRNHLKMLAFEWAYDRLSQEGRDYLRSLSKDMRFKFEGKRILLTHGSIESIKEYVDADSSQERLDELARLSDADIIVSGHSHLSYVGRAGRSVFINTGSVGRPDDGDPRACYAMLALEGVEVKIRHHRVKYDLQKAIDGIIQAGLPDQFAAMIEMGRDLDYVMQDHNDLLGADSASPADTTIQPIPPSIVALAAQLAVTNPAPQAPLDHDEVRNSAMKLAMSVRFEQEHAMQVTRLALAIFDQLAALHGMGAEERNLLELAAILHDIGWIKGQKGHHKSSLEMILASPILKTDWRARLIIANVARYHRKALPTDEHERFVAMNEADRQIVRKLAAILRVADGLDRTHSDAVAGLSCQVGRRGVTITCKAKASAVPEKLSAVEKADLFEEVFQKKVDVKLGG